MEAPSFPAMRPLSQDAVSYRELVRGLGKCCFAQTDRCTETGTVSYVVIPRKFWPPSMPEVFFSFQTGYCLCL